MNFTNAQIQNITKDFLLLPTLINDPNTGYIKQKQQALAQRDSFLKSDEDQKVFSDMFISAIEKYHAELSAMNTVVRTNYLNQSIVDGGSRSGIHYPTSPMWIKLVPKIHASNTGLPISNSGILETTKITEAQDVIPLIKTGFNDGTESFTGTITGTTLSVEGSDTIAAGKRLLFTGSGSFIAKVISSGTVTPPPPVPPETEVLPPTTSIVFEVIAGTIFSGACNAIANFSGFTDAQRSGTASLGAQLPLYNSLKQTLETKITTWKSAIVIQKNALSSNPDIPPRKSRIASALANVTEIFNTIETWEAKANLVVNGKLTDNGLTDLITKLSARPAQITARVTEIGTDLGTLSQDAEGVYTGSGVYLELYKIIDLRITYGVGTLSQYVTSALSLGLFDKKIENANNQIEQYGNIFEVKNIMSDTTVVGQFDFLLDSVSGLSNGDTVYVMDNESMVYSHTISLIMGSTVRLDGGVPVELIKSKLARIVKQK